jgi:hypothetical protein
MKPLFFVCLLVIDSVNAFNQCNYKNTSFTIGEKVEYEVAYNWGFIWVAAGTASFEVKSSTYREKPVYYFDSYGSSYKSYDWFYKVRDRFQAYVDTNTLQTLWAQRNTSEGSNVIFEEYQFDHNLKQISSDSKLGDKPVQQNMIKFSFCVTDLLSAIYFARNIDFSKYTVHDKIPIFVLIEGKTYPLYIRYLGKEILTLRDKKQYQSIKFSCKIVEGTVFKGGEDLFVWVSDDSNHLALLIEAKILVGSIKALLKYADGLKNPFSSIVQSEK